MWTRTQASIRGETQEHANGVTVTDYWQGEEVVLCEVWDPEAKLHVDVQAQEVSTWLSLRFPDHFLRDGTCLCPDAE